MIPIGFGLLYAGYTVGIWGYCLIRGYDVPFTSMFGQQWQSTASGSAGGVTISPPTAGHQLGTITGNQQIVS